jgi:hypothetical protein
MPPWNQTETIAIRVRFPPLEDSDLIRKFADSTQRQAEYKFSQDS